MSTTLPSLNDCTVAVIGLGYVGLPLAVEFAYPQICSLSGLPLQRRVIGFDINSQRLEELRQGIDCTNETTPEELQVATLLEFTSDPAQLADADVFVVTVPTPIDGAKRPDLIPLERASATVGFALKQRRLASTPVVIYESTVYPGATEEVCVPILERESGLALDEGFCCGYSPERINPGDVKHKLTTITKVTSGSSPAAAAWVDAFYGSIIKAGTHLAPSIKVAEAAKVIENTQRDINIALVNELAILFSHIGIDTLDVLEAAATKWNFLPFRPGLVGGHCIGVDPYYLTYKAEQLGYHPQMILSGRRINDGMARWSVEKLILLMARKSITINKAKVLILGFSFKENCPDFRNTRVVDLINTLKLYGIDPVVVDPWVDVDEVKCQYNISILSEIPEPMNTDRQSQFVPFSSIVVAVGHNQFTSISSEYWKNLIVPDGIFFDFKGLIPRDLNPYRV